MNTWSPTLADALPASADPGVEACDDPRPLIERQLWVLERLAEAGLNIALGLEREALAASPPPGAPDDRTEAQRAATAATLGDLALAYSRASRSVRLCIALQTRLITEAEDAAKAARKDAVTDAILDSPDRSPCIQRIVRRIARAEHDDDVTVDWLVRQAGERMADSDRFGDIMRLPISEIIAGICRDLNLSPDWSQLAQEAWAVKELATAAPGEALTPFAAPRPADFALRPPRPPPGFSAQRPWAHAPAAASP
jgi:hypothetical protein